MARVRTKSIAEIREQSQRIQNELDRRISNNPNEDEGQNTRRYDKVRGAERRYINNIDRTTAKKNDNARLDKMMNGDAKAYVKEYNKMVNRKYKGYQNAATTASVG